MDNPVRGQHILIVGAGYRNKQRTFSAAVEMGLRLTVVGAELPTWAAPFVDRHISADTYDLEETLGAVLSVHAYTPFDGVITFWDRDVETVAHIAAALSLPGCPTAAAALARNKYDARVALNHAGVPVPRFAPATNWSQLSAAAEHVGYPLICKPVSAAASKGVFRVDDPAGLRPMYDELITYVQPQLDPMFRVNPGQFLVEELMTGREVSVEGVVAHGTISCVGVTEKWTTSDHFVEYQHAHPARLSVENTTEVCAVAASAVRAMGLDNCGFHAEIMICDAGPKIVEVNGRLGGDLIATHLVPLASGVELVAAALLVALGKPPDLRKGVSRGACVRFLLASETGRVTAWRDLSSDRLLPGLKLIGQEKQVGEEVLLPPIRFADNRLSYAVADGRDTDEAIRNAENALSTLAYTMA